MEPITVTGTSSPAREGGDVPPELSPKAGPKAGPTAGPSAENSTAPGVVRRSDGGRVLVLNASYEPLNVCSVTRAVVLILKEKAELLEQGERTLHSESITLPHPVVIRL